MLHPRLSRYARPLLVAVLALGSLQAQDPGFYKDVKIRLGYGLQSRDNLRATSLGFGLHLGYATPSTRWGVELGYFYKPGDSYMVEPRGTVPGDLAPLDPDRFGDSRRNSLDGFALRLSCQRALSRDWDWQAGVMLGGTRFKHEYVGQAQSTDWATADDATDSWLDTWNGTPAKTGLAVSPFLGVTWRMSEISSVEFNLLLLTYTARNYVHYVGTGDYQESGATDSTPGRISVNNAFPQDTLESSKRLVPHLEVGYVFHF